MDPVLNPYAPGAGTRPPELAGRDEVREAARIALARTRIGRPSKSTLMVGLRGVGKTVLLDRMREDTEAQGMHALSVEASETRSLPSILAPQLRQALLRLSRQEAARHLAQRGLRALAGFASALKVKYQDIEVGLDLEPEPGSGRQRGPGDRSAGPPAEPLARRPGRMQDLRGAVYRRASVRGRGPAWQP